MFPDSIIAKHFQCGDAKCAYMAAFGIAPYLQDNLRNQIIDQHYFVLLFDESMNKKNQGKQLDFHVRFWDNDNVISHYYQSHFLGHARADDLMEAFTKVTHNLPVQGLVQLSMDGPAVNWKFHQSVQEELARRQDCQQSALINIGSCGLHIVHNAFKVGSEATGWNLDYMLLCLYQLFKDTLARRDDYGHAIGENDPLFPLKYCKTRWIENVPVIERALLVLPSVAKYVKAISEKFPDP